MKRFLIWGTACILLLIVGYAVLDRSTRVYQVREGIAQPQLARTSDTAVLLLPKLRMGVQTNVLLRRLDLGFWSLLFSHLQTEYSGATVVEIRPTQLTSSSLPAGMWRAVGHEDALVLDSIEFGLGTRSSYKRTCLQYTANGNVPCNDRLQDATNPVAHETRQRPEVDLDLKDSNPHWIVEYLDAKTGSADARFNLTVGETPIVIRRQMRSSIHDESGEFDEDDLPFFRDERIEISGLANKPPLVFVPQGVRTVSAEEYAALFPSSRQESSWREFAVQNATIVVVLLVGILTYLVPFAIKFFLLGRAVRNSIPSGYELLPALPSQFPLDAAELAAWTSDLDREGFSLLGEFSVVPLDVPTTHRRYLRLWAHERLQMMAIFTHISGNRIPPSQSLDVSTALEDDWYVQTTNRRLGKDRPMDLHRQSLGFLYPGASVRELIERNQERRTLVMADLEISPVPVHTVGAFKDLLTRRAAFIRKQAFSTKTMVYAKWLLTRRLPSKRTENWGAFAEEKDKKTQAARA